MACVGDFGVKWSFIHGSNNRFDDSAAPHSDAGTGAANPQSMIILSNELAVAGRNSWLLRVQGRPCIESMSCPQGAGPGTVEMYNPSQLT